MYHSLQVNSRAKHADSTFVEHLHIQLGTVKHEVYSEDVKQYLNSQVPACDCGSKDTSYYTSDDEVEGETGYYCPHEVER